MNNDYALSEVIRKLANLIRLGKIEAIDGNRVRVKIGRVVTAYSPPNDLVNIFFEYTS